MRPSWYHPELSIDITLIFDFFWFDDLWNFICDDTDEFLKIWTHGDSDTNTDGSTFKDAVSFRKKTDRLQL